MNGWNEDITNAIAYIEENLMNDIDIIKIWLRFSYLFYSPLLI